MKIKIKLDSDLWGDVLNALDECEGHARVQADMWEGRCREQSYRDEQNLYASLYDEIRTQLSRKMDKKINRGEE